MCQSSGLSLTRIFSSKAGFGYLALLRETPKPIPTVPPPRKSFLIFCLRSECFKLTQGIPFSTSPHLKFPQADVDCNCGRILESWSLSEVSDVRLHVTPCQQVHHICRVTMCGALVKYSKQAPHSVDGGVAETLDGASLYHSLTPDRGDSFWQNYPHDTQNAGSPKKVEKITHS